jgi:hypothetical protein
MRTASLTTPSPCTSAHRGLGALVSTRSKWSSVGLAWDDASTVDGSWRHTSMLSLGEPASFRNDSAGDDHRCWRRLSHPLLLTDSLHDSTVSSTSTGGGEQCSSVDGFWTVRRWYQKQGRGVGCERGLTVMVVMVKPNQRGNVSHVCDGGGGCAVSEFACEGRYIVWVQASTKNQLLWLRRQLRDADLSTTRW